jgi:hypothetical protein
MIRGANVCSALVALAAAFGLCSTAAADDIYRTGFEPPDFVLDVLDGQNGWSHSRVTNPDDAIVTDEYPADGSQGVKILGDQVFQVPNMVYWFSGHFPTGIDFDPLDMGLPVVTFQADMAFIGPGTDEDIYSGNIEVVDRSFRPISAMWLSSDGTLHIADGNDVTEYIVAGYDFGTYYTLAMTLDYVNRVTDFSINGDYVGTIPFANGSGDGFFSGYLEVQALQAPVDYDAYFDNYLVSASAP